MGGPDKTRRRPTLPHTLACSTIGSGGLNFRVRDGIGCDPSAIAARKPLRMATRARRRSRIACFPCCACRIRLLTRAHGRFSSKPWMRPNRRTSSETRTAQAKPVGRLVVVSSGRCRPSTSTLSTLSSTTVLKGTLILELASRLDAFSGYPFRT